MVGEKKLSEKLPYWLFLVVYAFAYFPYFIFYALPDIQQDSYIYFWAATLIRDGILPFPKFTIDVPVGHPAFIWVIKTLFGKTGAVVIVQNVLFLVASLYFISAFGKLSAKLKWIAATAISLFAIDNFTMRMNTSLYTESVYTSSLIVIGANLAMLSAHFTKRNLMLLVFSLLIPGLFRPNGIYVFFLVPLLLITFYKLKLDYAYYKTLTLSLIAVLLVWSSINLFFKGIFLPSDPYRITLVKNVVNEQLSNEKYYDRLGQSQPAITQGIEDGKHASNKYLITKKNLLITNLTAFAQSKPSFYFSILPTRNKQVYEDDMVGDPNQLLFNRFRVDSAAPKLKTYLFAEYIDDNELRNSIAKDCMPNQSFKTNPWLFFNHIFYKLYDFFIWNMLWVVIYCVLGLYAIFNFLKYPELLKRNFLLVSLFLLHFVSVIIITFGHGGFQLRYAHVTAIFLLMFVLSQMFSLFEHSLYSSKQNAQQ